MNQRRNPIMMVARGVLAALLCSPGFLSAQTSPSSQEAQNEEPLRTLTLEELGEIEVTTPTKEPVPEFRTPAAVYVLTQDDIRRSGATSIPEVLRLVPGVEVARIDSDHWAVGVRGFGSALSKSLLVLIDGRSVYTPLFGGVYWEVQNVLLEDVDRIEVIRGPGGTIWGANAVNGVINIITKSSKDTRGSLATAGGGNVDQGAGGYRYGGGNNRGLSYRVYGMGFTRGPEFHPHHNNYDDWRMAQGGFRADWDSGDGNTLTLQGDIYNEDAGQSATEATFTPPYMASYTGNAELSGGNLLGRWKRVFSERSDVQIQAYYDRTRHFEPQFGEIRDTFDLDFLHHLTLKGRQDFLWGLEARVSPSTFFEIIPAINFEIPKQTDQIYSGFIQDEIPILQDKLAFTIGSKFEHNNYTGFEIQPSARLLWTPDHRNTVWLAATRAVRTPSRVDEEAELTGLLLVNPLAFFQVTGNNEFSSEQLISYEAGYRTLIRSKFYLDLSIFRNGYQSLFSYGYQDASVTSQTAPPPPHLLLSFPIVNGIEGFTDGFEVAPDWKPKSWWQLKGSYSYLHLSLKNEPGNLDHSNLVLYEGSSPQHEVAIQSLFNLPKRFEFDQTYRYVSGLASQSVSGYNTADARIGWHTRHVEISLAGQNLLQPRHAEFAAGGTLIERTAYAKITLTK